MKRILQSVAGTILVLGVFLLTLYLLQKELSHYQLRDFTDGLRRIPTWRLLAAVGLTALDYVLLMGYETLGARYLGRPLHAGNLAFGSFLGYALAHNFGTLLGGSTVRYRLYSSWGFSAGEIVRLVIFLGVTFWMGVFTLGGVVFLRSPIELPRELNFPVMTTRPLGYAMAGIAILYLVLCGVLRRPLKVYRWELPLPPLKLAIPQFILPALDLMVAAGVPYVLLSDAVRPDYGYFLGVYLIGIIAAMITQVPGGLGVMELAMLMLIPATEKQDIVGSLLAFRAIYYLLPLGLALMALSGHELIVHGSRVKAAVGLLGRWMPSVAPRVLAACVFLGGVMLTFSVGLPAHAQRLDMATQWFGWPLMEFAHGLTAVVGILLLVMARGLQRRVARAYTWTLVLLVTGALGAFIRGWDYEEAAVLGILGVLTIPCQSHFYRQTPRIVDRLSPRWVIGVLFVLIAAVALFLFSHKHLPYTRTLWTTFSVEFPMARAMRSLVFAALTGVGVLAFRQLRRPSPLEASLSAADEQAVRKIVEQSSHAWEHLALLGDKRFLLNANQTAFIMYGEEDQTLVALGDPVGPEDEAASLIWDFWDLAEATHGQTVFYQVDERLLPLYMDIGLSVQKIGDEARVPLQTFSVEHSACDTLRHSAQTARTAGIGVEILAEDQVTPILDRLAEINDQWLAAHHVPERGFAVGFFDPAYLASGPVAVARRNGQIIGFANILPTTSHNEVSVDLIRLEPTAERPTFDLLLVELMAWAHREGYRYFNLGIAPLPGTTAPHDTDWWKEIASTSFRHGEHFPQLSDLRAYKAQFSPEWTGKYLATPSGFALPRVVTDIGHLVTRGVRRLAGRGRVSASG